jgi:integrase
MFVTPALPQGTCDVTSPKRLTDISINNLKPKASRYEVPDGGARGLYVIVHPTGKKSFAVRYRYAALPRKLTLQAGISLAAAHKLAADAMHEVAQGRDPGETKKAVKTKAADAAVNTVQAICEEYFKREHGKLRTAKSREKTLRRLVFPTLGSRQIDAVKRSEIVRLLDKIEDNSGARSADLALSYLGRVFNWFAKRDDDFRSPLVRGMGRYDNAANARSRVLTDDELRTMWKASEAAGYFGPLMRFLLLTAARRGEGAALRWDEIKDGDWLLPAAKHKNNTELLRPLSKAAQKIIAAQPRMGDYVFSFDGRRPISFGRCKRDFQTKCDVRDWRLHDLRRTARTLMSRAGVNSDIAERCLGHVIPGVRGIYDRHAFRDEMAHAFEALAAQIERIINPTDNVTPLRRPARGDSRAEN